MNITIIESPSNMGIVTIKDNPKYISVESTNRDIIYKFPKKGGWLTNYTLDNICKEIPTPNNGFCGQIENWANNDYTVKKIKK